jgi:uncharacterized protein (TIGR00369 family)
VDAADLVASMPHAVRLGIELSSASTDTVEARMRWRDDLCTTGGVVHGGAMMAFADSTGAVLAFLNLPDGATTATLESKTNFFRPFTSGTATATSRLVHAGRTLITVQTEVKAEDGRLLSLTTQTQAVIRPHS